MTDTLSNDPTVDEVRAYLAPRLPAQAAFDGWNEKAVTSAAAAENIDSALAILAFQDGAVDMIDAWFRHLDVQLQQEFPAEKLANLKIREKIATLVFARLMMVAKDKEALRRAHALLAMPPNLPRAGKMAWRAADIMWRLVGDQATDYNHYTKRGLLSAVYGSTVAIFINDESEDHAETRGFLDRRIENVMQFEKVKAKVMKNPGERFDMARFLGRLRYRGS